MMLDLHKKQWKNACETHVVFQVDKRETFIQLYTLPKTINMRFNTADITSKFK